MTGKTFVFISMHTKLIKYLREATEVQNLTFNISFVQCKPY